MRKYDSHICQTPLPVQCLRLNYAAFKKCNKTESAFGHLTAGRVDAIIVLLAAVFSTPGYVQAAHGSGGLAAAVGPIAVFGPLMPGKMSTKSAAGLSFRLPNRGQRSGTGQGGQVVAQSATFGPVTPGKGGTPLAVLMPFRLPVSRAAAMAGYRVAAVSTFVFVPAAPAAGGKSIAASDIGVGITEVSSTLGANANATIATGFDYDPAAVREANGARSFTGAASGRTTLADLLANREVLLVAKSSSRAVPVGGADLMLSVKIAVPTQFFTPGSFSGTITLMLVQ